MADILQPPTHKGLDPAMEANIAAALDRAKREPAVPVAVRVEHLPAVHLLMLHLSNGQRLALPIEDLEGLTNATAEQISQCEILGPGLDLYFPDLDANFYVPYLMRGIYGNPRWMRELESRRDSTIQTAA